MVRTVQAAAFKQSCLALMDEVAESGDTIIITKRGKPVARLVSMAGARPTAIGCLADAITVLDEDFSLSEWPVASRKAKR